MNTLMRWIGWIVVFGSSVAYAAPAGETNSLGLLVYLFLAVVALIICTQVIPVCVLFFGMTKKSPEFDYLVAGDLVTISGKDYLPECDEIMKVRKK